MPIGRLNRLVGNEAESFIKENLKKSRKDQYFCISRGFVCPDIKNDISRKLPFLSFENDGISNLTLCKMCSSKKNTSICNHDKKERQFLSTLLFEDIYYIVNDLNYEFSPQIVYFWEKKEHLLQFSQFSTKLMSLRKSTQFKFESFYQL